ncbi:MAG TPA: RNA polymerase sigma factor [Flavobacteriales bacterium]|nr:RNA polymerase sigma factor [Flavobacteriales bacterium]
MKDPELIQALRNKNQGAFRLLVDTWKNKVFNTCIGVLQHAEDAEEITQDVFIEVYHSVNKFDGRSTLATWIYRIAINKSLDKLRHNKSKKRSGLVQRFFNGSKMNDAPDFVHPGVEMEQKELSVILFKAIDNLSENQKTAYVLHYVEGLPQREIAEIMKTTIGSVESLLMRAKGNLRKLLGNYYAKNFK